MSKAKSNTPVLDICVRVCFLILVFFMITIVARFLTRQILVEKLNWDNVFTKIVFLGDERMGIGTDAEEGEGTAPIVSNWAAIYPFGGSANETTIVTQGRLSDKYVSYVKNVEDKIEQYTDNMLFGHMQITRAGKKYNSIIGCADMPMNVKEDEDSIIILNNGYMTYTIEPMEMSDVEMLVDNVSDFSDWLKEKGIGFIYANAGSKICETDKQLPVGETDSINENADELIELLENRGVDVLDYRPYQLKQYPDWYSSYYKTDHHWKNTTGLWAAGVLADYLNRNYNFDFDLKYFDESMYNIETTDDCFLGGQGRSLTLAVADLEPFSKVTPRFDTDISIQVPSRGVDIRGSYNKTLFREEFYDSIVDYSDTDYETKPDAYSAVMWRNDALGTVQNYLTTDNQGKRILMLQDSFGYFLSTYLALDIPEIDLVNLGAFTGSIRTYIEATKPDVVVVLLCEKNIKPIDEADYAMHESCFDFR